MTNITATASPASCPETARVIAGGSTALIKLQSDSSTVVKSPYFDSRNYCHSVRDLAREFAIYQRLPPHPRLLQLHTDSSSDCLILPFLENGSLKSYLRNTPVSSHTRIQFAADAAEGLSVLHARAIIHGDINSWNFLVDGSCRLCIIDFAGSTTENVMGSAFEGVRYCLPRSMDDSSTVLTDLFALGSLLFEIEGGQEPYHDYDDAEVERLFRAGTIPLTQHFALGSIIQMCWHSRYKTAKAVHEDIVVLLEHSEGNPPVVPLGSMNK